MLLWFYFDKHGNMCLRQYLTWYISNDRIYKLVELDFKSIMETYRVILWAQV